MQISEAESVVMEILWARHPRTSEEVVAALADAQDWQEATIKTLLNRLLNKGAISAERMGPPQHVHHHRFGFADLHRLRL